MTALRNIGNHLKWKSLVYLYLVIGLLCTGVNGQSCPTGFTDIDPAADVLKCVAFTAGTQTTLPHARLTCQQMGRAQGVDADLMRVDSSDLTNIAMIEGIDTSLMYWVGLTDAAVPTAPEWVIDCTAYNSVMQPFLDETPPCSTEVACNCFVYDAVEMNLKETNCVDAPARRSLCAVSQADDFPEILCPQNYVPIKDRCYRFYTGLSPGLNFDDAQARCVAEGAELARANQYDCNYAQIFDRAVAASINMLFLVGLVQDGGNVLWRDGTQAVFADDNGGSGDCFAINTNDNTGAFNRQMCTVLSANIICEQDARQPTTPGFMTTADDLTTPGALESTAAPADDATTAGTGPDASTPGPDVSTAAVRDVTTVVDFTTDATDVTTGDGFTTPRPTEQTTERVVCCPDGSVLVGEQCYAIVSDLTIFNDAVSGCAIRGGTLARVTPDVQQFLVDYFTANTEAASVWIGLLRSQEGGTDIFTWVSDNTELIANEASWADGQPSGPAGVNCVFSINVPTNVGNWFLANCFSPFDYICQFDLTEDCFDTPCSPNPCDFSGGPITCSSPGFGQSVCTCGVGYEMEAGSNNLGPCVDIDECLDFPCDEATQDCTNTVGSFTCDCKAGLTVNPVNPSGPCIPIDVCDGVFCDTTGPQGATGIFCNMDGNCECTTPSGYVLEDADGPCININECSNTNLNMCDQDSTTCVDTIGSFMCNCRDGFEPIPNDDTTCSAIVDPCDPNPCLPGQFNNIICNVATGACSCPTGYELSGGSTTGPCVDIDECTRGTDNCVDQSTTCVNTIGSFSCACRTGFDNLQGTFCSDINECTTGTDNCDPSTTSCSNTIGSFVCQCLNGFDNLQTNFCSDIDECVRNTDNCDDVSTTCVDTDGSFTCQCLTGYVPFTSTTCRDLCTAEQSSCDLTTTTCNFNSGIVTCTCLTGFVPITGNPNACEASTAEQCCPDTSDNNRFLLLDGGICVFLARPSPVYDFTAFESSICSQATSDLNASGGKLLDLANQNLNADLASALREFVNSQTVPFAPFPPNVWVDLMRATSTSSFFWGSGTLFPSDHPDWSVGAPSGGDLNCGTLVNPSDDSFGYTNIQCDTDSFAAYCSVDTVDCPAALTARGIFRLPGETFQEEYNDQTSDAFQSMKKKVDDMGKRLPDKTLFEARSFTRGSVIAHVEVTVRKPHRIKTVEMLEEAIRNLGETDQDGLLTIVLPTGETVVVDANRLEIDDLNNHLCFQDTCKNNGTCIFDERLIEANCRCLEGFEGDRCEAIKGETGTGLIIALAVLMVVMIVVFASCFCCFFILTKNRAQKNSKMVYRYRPPTTEVFAPPGGGADRRVVVNTLATTAGVRDRVRRPASIPRVVRNRGLSHDTEMDGYSNPSMELDHDDVESSVDQKRLSHFERIFYNAAELNSRMSYRGDAASVASRATSSGSSMFKPPISESMDSVDETREFNTPYTADGTENI